MRTGEEGNGYQKARTKRERNIQLRTNSFVDGRRRTTSPVSITRSLDRIKYRPQLFQVPRKCSFLLDDHTQNGWRSLQCVYQLQVACSLK